MKQTLMLTLSINIRRIRKKRGLSQEGLASVAGLHRTYIGSVERGERNITISTLQRIAEALEIDPLELLKCER